MSYYRRMPKNQRVLLSTREAASILNVDARTVQRKAERKELPGTKLPGLRGAYVFERADILAARDAEQTRRAS